MISVGDKTLQKSIDNLHGRQAQTHAHTTAFPSTQRNFFFFFFSPWIPPISQRVPVATKVGLSVHENKKRNFEFQNQLRYTQYGAKST